MTGTLANIGTNSFDIKSTRDACIDNNSKSKIKDSKKPWRTKVSALWIPWDKPSTATTTTTTTVSATINQDSNIVKNNSPPPSPLLKMMEQELNNNNNNNNNQKRSFNGYHTFQNMVSIPMYRPSSPDMNDYKNQHINITMPHYKPSSPVMIEEKNEQMNNTILSADQISSLLDALVKKGDVNSLPEQPINAPEEGDLQKLRKNLDLYISQQTFKG